MATLHIILAALKTSFIFLQAVTPEDEEFNLFLFTLLLFGIIFIVICVIIAIILTLLCLLAIFGFIAIGALSASVLIGIHKKSLTSGFRYFVIIFCTVGLGTLGTGAFWLLNRFTHWFSLQTALLSGALIGMVSGLIAGICLSYLIRKFSEFLKTKIKAKPFLNKV